MKSSHLVEKYFFYALLGITIFLMLAILYPFITILVMAAAFAVVLDPVYLWIKHHLAFGFSSVASFLTVLLFVVVLCAPVLFIGSNVLKQTHNAYDYISSVSNQNNTFFKTLDNSINKVLPQGMSVNTESKAADIVSFISQNTTSFFTATIQTIIMFMFMILAIFYFLRNGKEWKKSFSMLWPISENNTNEIFSKLHTTINQVIKGTFIIAIIQGFLTGIGFMIFGVPNATLWAVTAGIASFVPTVGTSLVFVPAILFLFFTGMHVQAIGLLVWSLGFVAIIDDLLSPFIISKKTEMPPFFILFSILGGISLMGPEGILIGPLVLSLLYSLISIYKKEIKLS
ncbi:MAG: AI-2E family transporter [Patescibacteria group bacterium]|nr:AI-2E family transporter [Patescibacteria group bacterium]